MGIADPQQSPPAGARAAARLRAAKPAIISRWEERVRADERHPEADRQSGPTLRDSLPQLIDQLVGHLESRACDPRAPIEGAPLVSHRHAVERHRQGYDISAVLRELVHLRAAVIETLATADGPPIDPACRRVVEDAFDQIMIRSAAELDRLSTDQLRQEAAFRERFIAILGHDLRQPLNTVVIAAELLGQVRGAAPLAERVGRSARRMDAMIRELLDFSIARKNGTITITRTTADLRALLVEVTGELELAHPGAAFELDAPESQHGLWDPVRLMQVVSNLAGNALQHGPEGRPIRIALRGDEEAVTVTVHNENRGPPLAPELIERLFEPYEAATTSAGLGLGLFIACQVVKGHGGRIDVESDERGTTFRVHLPRR